MYRHCISCSAGLGANEALEAFPVGRSIAFDVARGRLWAVCPARARWNLSPIEERWEAVEAAEKRFRDTRLRAQGENVGVARLADGTRLIRIGAALRGEVAAWRYGGRFPWRGGVGGGLLAAGAAAVALGAATLSAGGAVVGAAALSGHWLLQARRKRREEAATRKVVHRVFLDGEWTGLRGWHARASVLRRAEGGGALELLVPDPHRASPRLGANGPVYGPAPLVLRDAEARAFLRRGLVHVNEKRAPRRLLNDAVALLDEAGDPDDFLVRVGGRGRPLYARRDMPGRHLIPSAALAVEIALHEEDERRAMEGELALLESAWREAEEIAAIADRLALEARTPVERPGTA